MGTQKSLLLFETSITLQDCLHINNLSIFIIIIYFLIGFFIHKKLKNEDQKNTDKIYDSHNETGTRATSDSNNKNKPSVDNNNTSDTNIKPGIKTAPGKPSFNTQHTIPNELTQTDEDFCGRKTNNQPIKKKLEAIAIPDSSEIIVNNSRIENSQKSPSERFSTQENTLFNARCIIKTSINEDQEDNIDEDKDFHDVEFSVGDNPQSLDPKSQQQKNDKTLSDIYGFSTKMKSLIKYGNIIGSLVFDRDIMFKKQLRFIILQWLVSFDILCLSMLTILDTRNYYKKADEHFEDNYNPSSILLTTFMGYAIFQFVSNSLKVTKTFIKNIRSSREFLATTAMIEQTQKFKLTFFYICFGLLQFLMSVQLLKYFTISTRFLLFWSVIITILLIQICLADLIQFSLLSCLYKIALKKRWLRRSYKLLSNLRIWK